VTNKSSKYGCPPTIGRLRNASLVPSIYQQAKCGRSTSAERTPLSDATRPARVADQAGTARGGGVGGAGHSLGSPVSERHAASGISNRKRNASLAGLDSSPGTVESPEADASDDAHHEDRRKQPVKRACNECRQQKVSHPPMRFGHACFVCQLTAKVASVQCRPRTLPTMLPLRATAPRMQDREQLQAHRQALSQCRDGEGDCRPEEAACAAGRQHAAQRSHNDH
jgi:hypothetical protein